MNSLYLIPISIHFLIIHKFVIFFGSLISYQTCLRLMFKFERSQNCMNYVQTNLGLRNPDLFISYWIWNPVDWVNLQVEIFLKLRFPCTFDLNSKSSILNFICDDLLLVDCCMHTVWHFFIIFFIFSYLLLMNISGNTKTNVLGSIFGLSASYISCMTRFRKQRCIYPGVLCMYTY